MSEGRNPFDQFDAPAGAGPNAFDQFDPNYKGPTMPAWMFQSGARANVLKDFGQGLAEGWGAEPLHYSDEVNKALKDAGIYGDLESGHRTWLQTFNETMLRPAASSLATSAEALVRGGAAAIRGYQAGVASLGLAAEERGLPGGAGLGMFAASLPEAFPFGARAVTGLPHTPVPAPTSPEATAAAIRALNPNLPHARSLGVIGEGEAGWKGTAEPTPGAAEEARAAAIRQAREDAGEITLPEVTVTPEPDVHQLARGLSPEVFKQYDTLGLQRDTLRRQLDELDDMRQQGMSPGIEALDREIAALRGSQLEADTRQARRDIATQVSDAETRRAAMIDALPERGDTTDMAALRAQMQALDFRMRDLAPDVSDAYRRAAAAEPVEAPAPAVAPEAAAPEEAAPAPALPPREVPEIRDDVYRQLLAAGRPADEANASAALVAAHYDARAARFEGALGTAEQLYAAEAPRIEAAARGRQGEQGRTIFDSQQATIRLMENADASTFIHESAHAWLEEMLRDATDNRAPADLRRDAGTIRNWLGVAEDQTIPTRGHEKFARGFERYLMEGRAPAATLGRVFDQFKQWLTQIYQTVARLRVPITDDIRDVYNRMLALPGREPVIAEDMRIPQEFADEHETIAERTPPEYSTGAAQRLRAESDRVALERAPEVHEELTGRGEPGVPGGGIGRNAPEGGGPGGNAAPAGPGPREAAAFEPAGAVGAGRAEAAPQGTGLGLSASRPFDRPGSQPETRFADRAGNIRLDNLGTPEDVNQVIRDTAVANADFIGARRGVISDAEALRLADALGMDASQLDRRKIGQAFNAEEVLAARKLLIQSATAVRDSMAKAATGTDQDVLAFAASMDRHRMIQQQVSGVTAEAGRALRAFRQLEGGAEATEVGRFVEEATGRTLFQLRRIAQAGQQLQTPQQVSKLIQDTTKPGFFDWLQSYFVNALISGPATHGTYMIGNGILALFKATAETGASALVGGVREAITGERAGARVEFGEIPAQLFGAMYGQRQAWGASWRALLSNETLPLPGEKIASGTAFGKGVIPNPAGIPIGTALEAPSRVVTALHTLTRVTSYEMSIHGQAYRLAAQEGLSGDRLFDRIRQLTETPTEEMMTEAVGSANENALMQRAPYGSITASLQRITNAGMQLPEIPTPFGNLPLGMLRPLKFVDPFVAISSNIIKSAILQRTPVGLFSADIRADLSGANGTLAFDRAAGRMLAGTSFYVMAGSLAAEGMITDSGPTDPKKASMQRMTGWMPHALKIGDVYYDMHRLGVMGMSLGIAADLYHVAHLASTEDLSTATSSAVHAFAQNILDESFMRGPSELIQALTDSDRHGPAFVRNFLSSFVPYSVGMSQIARVIDPYTRQARTITDAMIRKIPYESETLFPMRDIWGEPLPNHESVVPGLTAIYESRVNEDPVNQRMVALGMGPARPERKIRGVGLTDQQYDDYSRIAGRMAKIQLDKIVPAPGFAQLPEIVQREVISKTISSAREAGRALIMMQNPSIIQKAVEAKTAGLHPAQR